MEQNLPVIAKRIWGIVRVVFFMLRKNMSKRKLLLDLNMMMKRGKIASKALSNLMFHHHHHLFTTASTSSSRRSADHHPNLPFASQREYEFSCSNTPSYFSLSKRRNHGHNFFACAHAPATLDDDAATANALKAVLEMLNNNNDVVVEASPALPGFGKSPMHMVRQLRITDSPFPLRNVDEDSHVDEAAEEFIKRFYKDLKLQRGE